MRVIVLCLLLAGCNKIADASKFSYTRDSYGNCYAQKFPLSNTWVMTAIPCERSPYR